jgi:hypothetical protein
MYGYYPKILFCGNCLPVSFFIHCLSITEYGEYVNILSMPVTGEPLTGTPPRPPRFHGQYFRPVPVFPVVPRMNAHSIGAVLVIQCLNIRSLPSDRSPQILNSRLPDMRFAHAVRLLAVMNPYE